MSIWRRSGSNRRGHRDDTLEQVRTSAHKHLGLTLRPCQLAAADCLLGPTVVELDTGEGKTLVVAAAASALARRGCRVLIATSNDYLAVRDAQWMAGIYQDLGVNVAQVHGGLPDAARRIAYTADVVYGTLREFGFDQLRGELADRDDRAGSPGGDWIDRFDALVVDEADSVLIDEARVPMIITSTGALSPRDCACLRWCAKTAQEFVQEVDFVAMGDSAAIALTETGRYRLLRAAMPSDLDSFTSTELQHRLEQAIWVQQTCHPGKAYVVSDGQVRIVDEFTGRVSANRKLGNTLHQAIEAKEGLGLTPLMRPTARMTVQDFASRFSHLCGITGTAKEAKRELNRVYGLTVRRVPPHFASRRLMMTPRLAATTPEKWQRIAAEVVEATHRGRSVLVGTRTVVQSEELSRTLDSQGVEHVVLNARNPEREAEIVAQAGGSGRVTVATNMAGRGTDIRIDDASRAAGGLHVIVSEPHAAARIDRQMIGRAGRQGDPGSAVIFGSADDEILRQALGDEQAARIAHRARLKGVGPWLWRKLRQSQRLVELRHQQERAALAASDLALAEAAGVLGINLHLDPLPE